jgi:hypothetical protein
LLETKKILADVGATCVLSLAGAVRSMGLAVFNFLSKKKRHLSASLSQFDPEARDHSACQPLRIALGRIPGEFEDTVGDRFTNAVRILRAMEHGEHRVKGVAYKFGLTSSKTAPIAMTQPVLGIIVIRLDKSVGKSCDSRDGKFSAVVWIVHSTLPRSGRQRGRRFKTQWACPNNWEQTRTAPCPLPSGLEGGKRIGIAVRV